ncbi:MAG TPA: hypothetical protein PLJ60_04170 [Chryseolinea sp.]|nr:hypothetical protein [Chryseolinea sp.]HPM29512.1 hypothetical protein [Chryseolinea sp.]
MKEIPEYEKDLASIRNMMERSVKFISLSGMSGVLSGIYAILGAIAAYFMVHYPISPFNQRVYSINDAETLSQLTLIAIVVLTASLVTGFLFSSRKARKYNEKLWNATTKKLLINLCIPLFTGGFFILILLYTGHFGVAAPASLIFYGLALIQGSANMYDEVRYLGFCEIVLGLVSALFPGYGLIFWVMGFGILHVVYGTIMHNKYDR